MTKNRLVKVGCWKENPLAGSYWLCEWPPSGGLDVTLLRTSHRKADMGCRCTSVLYCSGGLGGQVV